MIREEIKSVVPKFLNCETTHDYLQIARNLKDSVENSFNPSNRGVYQYFTPNEIKFLYEELYYYAKTEADLVMEIINEICE